MLFFFLNFIALGSYIYFVGMAQPMPPLILGRICNPGKALGKKMACLVGKARSYFYFYFALSFGLNEIPKLTIH